MDAHTTLLTVEEFADRLKVGRSTVFAWMQSGALEAGVHYIRIAKTVRFFWGPELIAKLCEATKKEADSRVAAPKPTKPGSTPRHTSQRGRGPAVNFDF